MRSPALSRTVTLRDTNQQALLSADDICFQWGDGLPTLHIAATPAGAFNSSPNTKGRIKVAWANERGGGEAWVDLGRGQSFTVGAAYTSLTVEAQFVPSQGDLALGTPLVIPCPMSVSMSVGGQGTLSAVKPLYSSLSWGLNHESTVSTPILEIPPFAVRGRVFSDIVPSPASAFPASRLTFFESDVPTTIESGFGAMTPVGRNTHYQVTNLSSSTGRFFVLWEIAI